MAQTDDGDHVLVTIITDGEENSSEEWTLKMVRTMIEKLKKQGWTFTLIGTDNLDVETMAHSFAIDEHLEFRTQRVPLCPLCPVTFPLLPLEGIRST